LLKKSNFQSTPIKNPLITYSLPSSNARIKLKLSLCRA